ncbi:MAG: DUF3618 domain-containing protein [Pseudomonadota bacterium]
MSTHKSASEIEQEIETERDALARSLEALQAQFSPEQVVNTATEYLRDNGGDIVEAVGRQIKENPMAASVTAMGLAWLAFGSPRGAAPARDADGPRARAGDPFARGDRVEGGQTTPSPGFDERSYATAPGLSRTGRPAMTGFDDRLAAATSEADDPSFWGRAEAAGAQAAEKIGGIARSAKQRAMDGVDGSQDRDSGTPSGGQTGSAQGVGRSRQYARSQDLMTRISEGTEQMSEAARLRVMEARHRAYAAQRETEHRLGAYSDRAGRLFDTQPLLGGLLMAGVGALVGAALPRTSREDDAFGMYRDRAFDEAERIFHEEREKLRAVANAALSEAGAVAEESLETLKASAPSGSEAVGRAEHAVTSATDRITEAAKDEAKKQKLGQGLN